MFFVSARTYKRHHHHHDVESDNTRATTELSPPKSAYAGDAVLRTSTRGTVPMGSALGAIEDNISQCPFLQVTFTAEIQHTDGTVATGTRPRFRPPRSRDPHATSPAPTTTGCGKTDVLSSANGLSTVALQQRCHRTSELVRSPFCSTMPYPIFVILAVETRPVKQWGEKNNYLFN